MGILTIVTSGIIGALFSLGYKVNGLRPNASDQLVIVMSAVSALLSVVCMIIFHQWVLPTPAIMTGIPQGAASFLAVSFFLSVTRRSRLNISWTIIQFYVVIPFFVSLVMFHDGFTIRGGGGVVLILGSILLFGRKAHDGSSASQEADRPNTRNLLMLITSTVMSGVVNSMPKVYTSVSADHPPFPQLFVANVTLLAIAGTMFTTRRLLSTGNARRGGKETDPVWTLSRLGFGVGIWMGFMQLAGSALLLVGLTLVAGTVAFPIRIVVNIVTVVILSRLIFGEELSRAEVGGTVVAMVGVALVASSA